MRNLLRLSFLLMLIVIVQFTSCQKEEIEIIDDNTQEEETINIDSHLTNLLFNVSINDGNNDDFIDGNSCLSIKFPFSVLVNETEFIVEGENNYLNIIDFIVSTGSSLEDIDISYPITIIFSDYSEILINNDEELISYNDQCDAGENDRIDCVQIVYPLQFFTYNSETEINDIRVANDNKELYLFISSLSANDFLTIEYPFAVLLTDDSLIEVSSNTEIENLIDNCVLEETDNVEELVGYLTSSVWYISSFIDGEDETANFCEYEFSFTSEGMVNVIQDSTQFMVGNWNMITLDSEIKLMLSFPNEIPFEKLISNWNILNGNSTQFELVGQNDNSLSFGREPISCDDDQIALIKSYLTTGPWFVNYFNDGEDKASNFCEYEFTFNEDGTSEASDGSNIVTGNWYVGINNNGPFVGLDYSQDDLPFYMLWNNWDVLNANINSIEIETECVCGGMHYLTFGRTPTVCQEDTLFLEETLQNGVWYVSSYVDNGTDETLDYYYYDLTFNNDGTVTAVFNFDIINGTWSIEGNEGDLEIVLDFGNTTFNELSTDWSVLDILIERVKADSNNGNNTLTLTKI